MDDKHTLIGHDGLVEFGQYLNTLHAASYRDYTVEMPGPSGALVACSLDDVIREFQGFFDSKREAFRVCITYVDCQMGTMGHTDRQFKRISK